MDICPIGPGFLTDYVNILPDILVCLFIQYEYALKGVRIGIAPGNRIPAFSGHVDIVDHVEEAVHVLQLCVVVVVDFYKIRCIDQKVFVHVLLEFEIDNDVYCVFYFSKTGVEIAWINEDLAVFQYSVVISVRENDLD